jgi:TRAP-type transport system periplasmic protein
MLKFSTLRRTVLATALLGATTLTFAQSTVKLTLGHGAAPGNPRHEASVKFADVVKAKTNGDRSSHRRYRYDSQFTRCCS